VGTYTAIPTSAFAQKRTFIRSRFLLQFGVRRTRAILPPRATRIGELGTSKQPETVIKIDPQLLPSIKGDHATTDYHSSPE
jgi:hypothetical protein